MLYKAKDFVNAGILKAIYHAIFESHIMHVCAECTYNQLFENITAGIQLDYK